MVVDRFIFENDQITLAPCLTFILNTVMGLLNILIVFTVHQCFSNAIETKENSLVRIKVMVKPEFRANN